MRQGARRTLGGPKLGLGSENPSRFECCISETFKVGLLERSFEAPGPLQAPPLCVCTLGLILIFFWPHQHGLAQIHKARHSSISTFPVRDPGLPLLTSQLTLVCENRGEPLKCWAFHRVSLHPGRVPAVFPGPAAPQNLPGALGGAARGAGAVRREVSDELFFWSGGMQQALFVAGVNIQAIIT